MRLLTALLLTILLAGCGQSDDARLPLIGTVGDLPPSDETLVISLDQNGAISVEGRPVAEDGLLALLVERTRDYPRDERFNGGRSRLNVLLRCDRDAMVSSLLPILGTLCDPGVRVTRLFYAVRPEAGGEVGAFAWFIPHDNCVCSGPHQGDPPRPEETVVVTLQAAGEPPVGSAGLCAALLALPEDMRTGCVSIRLHKHVSVSYLLGAADACLRAGAKAISFSARWRSKDEPGPPGGAGMRLFGTPVGPPGRSAPLPPPPPRVHGSYAGFANDIQWPLSMMFIPDED